MGLYGPRIWVFDPYGLIGKIQPVDPEWGAKGFDPFVLGGIASHYCNRYIRYIRETRLVIGYKMQQIKLEMPFRLL